MQLNTGQHEIIIKLVYYGPPLSGKTTNLQAVHHLLNPGLVGHLTTLNTVDDRTVFFDLLPLSVTTGEYKVRIKLFTVPGQALHAATRRLVLAGADGVVFVADSQLSENRVNDEYWHGMRRYLRENDMDPDATPVVVQFNKRDLPNVRSDAELRELAERGPDPVFKAVALTGEGVLETLAGALRLTLTDLDRRCGLLHRLNLRSDEILNALQRGERPSLLAAYAP